MDKKRTYYNSILSNMNPRFKYKPKKRVVDEDGNSMRDDLDDITDVSFPSGTYSGAKRGGRNQGTGLGGSGL